MRDKIFGLFCTAFLIQASAQAFELNVSYGKEQKESFSIITLKNDKPFACQTHALENNTTFIQCKIDAIPQNGFLPFETKFFKISYAMEDKSFILTIRPKQQLKLFYIPDDIENNSFFTTLTHEMSKNWQIIGYKEKLPFLSTAPKKPLGINFPISMNKPRYDFIGELDIDKKPLNSSMGADYADYIKVRELMQNKQYRTALNSIAAAFRKFPDTFFAKDLLFFQIKALYHLNLLDNVLESAPLWIKTYASDSNIPEALYLLGNTYAKINYSSEAIHFYKRIIEEYPQNRFAPLAKMQIAESIAKGTDTYLARVYYSQAYQEAKDLSSVSNIALQWAFFEAKHGNKSNAIELIDKILESNPSYFMEDSTQTKNSILHLEKLELYASAAQIAKYYFQHSKEEDKMHEELGFLLGELFERAGDFDNAYEGNLAFIKEYENLPKAREVQARNDKLLFEVSGDENTKLQRYEYILKKYPNTKQAKEAAELKAGALIKLGFFQKALEMQPLIPQNLYNDALLGLINKEIASNQCNQVDTYLVQLTSFDGLTDKLKAFDCLYEASSYAQAHTLASSMLEDKNSPDYLPWLYRDAKTLYALGKYQDSIMAAQDVLALAKTQKQDKKSYDDILFTLFNALNQVQSKESAKEVYAKLYERFKDDKRMMPIYATLLNDEKLENTTTLLYAKNLLALQEKYKSHDFTPLAEFKLIEALTQNNPQEKDQKEALQIAQSLVKKPLNPSDLQKALYTKANLEIALKLTKEATQSLESCLKVEGNSSWKTLCEQSKDLLKE